ncbi:MAG: lipoate--protein ligase family protein [Oscillatoriales cyanobacterium]|nr:MAG: lipoate--protein ligase family protein [Oscillatoriales cyanobacterium]
MPRSTDREPQSRSGVPWRLIPPIATDGLTQMAIDDWMIDRVRQGHPPILRFYTWSEPTLSLGFHQTRIPDHWWAGSSTATAADRDRPSPSVPALPIPLVRRPSGGRAVLHGTTGEKQTDRDQPGELTYAIVMPTQGKRRTVIYCDLCRFLIQGWASLGVTLHLGCDRDYADRSSCFGTATAADLVTDAGTKLIGSAQLYRGETVLQHGSMQLNPDRDRFIHVFGEPCEVPDLPWLTIDQIVAALTEAARSWFNVTFETQAIRATEWIEIEARRDRFRVSEPSPNLTNRYIGSEGGDRRQP